MMTKYRWAIICVAILTVSSFVFFSFSDSSTESPLFKALKFKGAVSSVRIPEKLEFAGEKVPLQNFDTRESLERELLINTYWHSQTILLLKKSKRFFPAIEPILKKYNIPDDFKYLAVAESGLAQVVSPSQAVGFWQIKEGAAKDYGLEVNDIVDERYHVEKSTEAACKFLRKSYNTFKSWSLSAASFNGGRKFVIDQMKQQKQGNYYDLLLGEETERYMFRMIAFKLIFENPQEYGFIIEEKDYLPVPCSEIEVKEDIDDFGQFAIDHKTNYKMLKMINPWLRKPFLKVAPNKTYIIKIPDQSFRLVNFPDTSVIFDTLPVNSPIK